MTARARRRFARVVVACSALAAPSCGGPALEGPDLSYRVRTEARVVAPGEPFPLVVERTWPRDGRVDAFDPRDLRPLVLRPTGSSRVEDASRVRETLSFSAQALALDDLRLNAPTMRVHDERGQVVRSARGDALDVRVSPRLDAAPQAIEPPPSSIEERSGDGSRGPLAVIVATLLLALAALRTRRRRRPPAVVPDTEVREAGVSSDPWRPRLEALLARSLDDAASRAEATIAANDLFVDALSACVGADARPWSAARRIRAVVTCDVARRIDDAETRARALLGSAERVKYGAHRPTAEAAHRTVGDAADLVRALTRREPA